MMQKLMLIGTFWPLLSFVVALGIALSCKGRWKWILLFVLPPLLMWPCYVFAPQLAYDGNLLFALLFMLSHFGWLLYYAILLPVAIVAAFRARQKAASNP